MRLKETTYYQSRFCVNSTIMLLCQYGGRCHFYQPCYSKLYRPGRHEHVTVISFRTQYQISILCVWPHPGVTVYLWRMLASGNGVVHLLWKLLWYIRCTALFVLAAGTHQQTRGWTYICMVTKVSFFIPLWWIVISFAKSYASYSYLTIVTTFMRRWYPNNMNCRFNRKSKNWYNEWCKGLIDWFVEWWSSLDLLTWWPIFKSITYTHLKIEHLKISSTGVRFSNGSRRLDHNGRLTGSCITTAIGCRLNMFRQW